MAAYMSISPDPVRSEPRAECMQKAPPYTRVHVIILNAVHYASKHQEICGLPRYIGVQSSGVEWVELYWDEWNLKAGRKSKVAH